MNRIVKSQEEVRNDIAKFLKQFVMIELQYHCKALEHLTEAYSVAIECETLIPMSSQVI